jgi:hypothetical protein
MNDLSDTLINTLLQQGDEGSDKYSNRFNGFSSGSQTVETVFHSLRVRYTLLKQGVNEIVRW